MKTLWNSADRKEMQERARRLQPGAQPAWGRMNAPQMVAHVADQLRMTLGKIQPRIMRTPARFFPIKQLFIYLLPWPKGAETIPELIARAPGQWGTEIDELVALIAEFEQHRPAQWPVHPLFHRLSRRAWGRLAYRHLDHHFTQFGV